MPLAGWSAHPRGHPRSCTACRDVLVVHPLFDAVVRGDVAAVRTLAASSVGTPRVLDARDESGATALFLASWTGKLKSVAALLARGANPDLTDSGGNTPLHTAARNGHDDGVAARLAGGANPRLLNQAKESPADRARKQGHASLAAKLS
ncbi:ankyrin repeat domain-containing protein [Corallococcus sp. M34]|nr:ankyrin repeat domain-containing protein [Citreicoccus inhibens]